MARDARRYWRGEIVANRHRAGWPSFRDIREEDRGLFRRLYRAAAGTPGRRKNGQSAESLSAIRGAGGGISGAAAIGGDFAGRIMEDSIWPIAASPDDPLSGP